MCVNLKPRSQLPQPKNNVLGVDINGTAHFVLNVRSPDISKITNVFAQTVIFITKIAWNAGLERKSAQ